MITEKSSTFVFTFSQTEERSDCTLVLTYRGNAITRWVHLLGNGLGYTCPHAPLGFAIWEIPGGLDWNHLHPRNAGTFRALTAAEWELVVANKDPLDAPNKDES